MRVFITGGSGLIGRHLVRRLVERGDEPVILSRHADAVRRNPEMRRREVVQGDPTAAGEWATALDGCDAVVNLAGHNIFAERWDTNVKRKIRDSRVLSTANVVAAIAKAKKRPAALVQGSAIGYYGIHGDEELTEESPSGADFMAVIGREWEEAAHPAETLGVRLARIRTGVVLAKDEGALKALTPIFKWVPLGAAPVGNGGSLAAPATGRQWMSWIHIDDIVGLFLLALDNSGAEGPINGTAPHPVRNSEFSKTLARTLWRPYVPLGPPDAVLRLLIGDVAQVVTTGQRVLPKRAQALGYTFKYPDLAGALKDIFKAPAPDPHATPVAASSAHH